MAVVPMAVVTLVAQSPESARVGERIRSLQREAEQLAAEARTLVGDLRRLEVERDLRMAQAAQAQSEAATARQALEDAGRRLATLESARVAQVPDLKAQLVDVYKRGRAGYVQLLLGARDLRELARATRAVAAIAAINRQRIAQHQQTLGALVRERARIEQSTRELAAREAAEVQASAAAGRAVAARAALAAQIDSRRDLTAQYVGELQGVYDRLQRQVVPAGGADAVAVPLSPFRSALDWPVDGRVTGRFGRADRLGGPAVKNGIDIAAAEGTPVRAIHGGTVGFADVFSGFGTLVILDHGSNSYSLYGYLASASVARGDHVDAGAELGQVGSAPGGPPALYFELRIDGRAVDPVEWLKRK
jgi:septal ring factor EnvC (AmiA/AmiB activator)